MSIRKALGLGAAVMGLTLAATVALADDHRYSEGPVVNVAMIRTVDGKFEDYMNWLGTTWKQQQEAMKQEALGMAQANTELEMARDEQKAALQAEGDARKQFTNLIGDVMRSQLQKAQGGEEGEEGEEAGEKKPAAKGAKPKRKRSIKFEEDAKGKMVGATIEED